jgi:Rrf2 family transcriptional regulator, iron-sulfur cluster assembly transcription factor
MKISAQDEYGLRILLQIAKAHPEEGLNLSQISELENISQAYAAKITRLLRIAGFIQSMRGHKGGYILALPASEIKINQVLKSMGGAIYDEKFCGQHSGTMSLCTNSVDCSLRSLWTILQINMDKLLDQISIQDLMKSENQVNANLTKISSGILQVLS